VTLTGSVLIPAQLQHNYSTTVTLQHVPFLEWFQKQVEGARHKLVVADYVFYFRPKILNFFNSWSPYF